jgi:hypothetical protein
MRGLQFRMTPRSGMSSESDKGDTDRADVHKVEGSHEIKMQGAP